MLAHSAFNIAHLRGNDANMATMALRYYNEALLYLKDNLGHSKTDSSAMLASVMSLMFAEVRKQEWVHTLEPIVLYFT